MGRRSLLINDSLILNITENARRYKLTNRKISITGRKPQRREYERGWKRISKWTLHYYLLSVLLIIRLLIILFAHCHGATKSQGATHPVTLGRARCRGIGIGSFLFPDTCLVQSSFGFIIRVSVITITLS